MSSPSISQLLASLPLEERTILTMHYLKSLSASEIADALGVPERAVASVIASGRARILQAVQGVQE